MANKHLPIGGSTADRTISCPGWLKLAKKVPKPKAGFSANEGNLLHDAMEEHYMCDTSFASMFGKLKFEDLILSSEHSEILQSAKYQTDLVLDKYNIDTFTCEPFVQYIKDTAGGSIDMLGASYCSKVTLILDYKFGASPVSPTNNAQLFFYALSAMTDAATKDFFAETEKIVFCIIQPKTNDEPKIWETDIKVVRQFEEKLLAALDDMDTLACGSHCKYCPAAAICTEKKKQATSALLIKPETAKEVAEALTLAREVTAWAKQVEEQAQDISERGGALPGYKLVAGRKTRKWTKDGEKWVAESLGGAAYKTELLTVAQAEKLLKKAEIALDEDAVNTTTGTPKLVPESDKRPEITPTVSNNLKKFVAKNTAKK